MTRIAFDVEVIVQEQNPICWIASCAMVKSFGMKSSVGIGDFTGGFDPSDSCIANLAGNWAQCTALMSDWGFNVSSVGDLASGTMTRDALLAALQGSGPAILLHMCSGFPYGAQWASQSVGPGDAPAVDTDADSATFNNPWGDKDQSCTLDALVQKINADQGVGKTLGFWRS